ncbi:MAG: tetratricopeptide repeat protein [Candidatus Pacearchaeota archaeon]
MNKKVIVTVGLLLVIAIGLGVGAYFYTQSKNTEGYDYFAKGEEFLKGKRYSEAIVEFRKEINSDNSNADAYLEIAKIYVLKNRFDDALSILNQGLENSKDERLPLLISSIYLDKKNDNALALENYQKTDRKDFALALLLIKNFKADEAKPILEGINSSNDNYPNARMLLAIMSFSDLNKAEEFVNLGGLSLTKYPRVEELRNAIKDGKEKGENSKVSTLTKIGYISLTEGYPELSIPIFQEVTKLLAEYSAGHLYLGVAYLKTGDDENAEKELLSAIELDSSSFEAYAYLGQLYRDQKKEKESIDSYDKALALKSDDENLVYEYANLLVKFGLFTKAELIYKNLDNYKNSDNWLTYRLELADLYLNDLKDYAKANKVMEDLIDEWKGFASLEPEQKAVIYDIYGWSYYKLEDMEKTQEVLALAYEQNEYDAAVNYHLGVILREQKDLERAKVYLERAIDLDTTGEVSVEARKELERI